MQLSVTVELLFQMLVRQQINIALALHNGTTGGTEPSQNKGNADHAFIAYHSNLSCSAVFQHIKQGHNNIDREINLAQRIARFIDHGAKWQEFLFKTGEKPSLDFFGQSGQQFVVAGNWNSSHEFMASCPIDGTTSGIIPS